MARYRIKSVGMRGRIHLYEEPRPLDNTVKNPGLTQTSVTRRTGGGNNSRTNAICFRGDRYALSVPSTNTVEIYQNVRGTWTLVKTFSDPEEGSEFGACVSISGGLLAVGAPGHNNGAGRVYLYSNRGGVWAPCDRSSLELFGEPDARFGASLDLDGTMLVVGAPFATGGSGGNGRFGMAFSYLYDLQARTWNDHAAVVSGYPEDGAMFGFSVALDREVAIAVGAPGSSVNQGETRARAGAVETFTRSGSTWLTGARLVNPTAANDENLGWSVSYKADRVLAGATGLVGGGGALMFVGSFSTWRFVMSFRARTSGASIVDTNAGAFDQQGVTVDQEFNTVFVSSPYAGAGTVYIWELTQAGNWLPAVRSKLQGTPITNGDRFGACVSAYGNQLMVGAMVGTGTYDVYRFQ